MAVPTGTPIRGIVTGNFSTTPGNVLWYPQGSSTQITPADLAEVRIHMHHISAVCGTAVRMRLFWGAIGDTAVNGQILDLFPSAGGDHSFGHANSAPEVPKGYGISDATPVTGRGVFVTGPGANSSIIIYATVR